MTSDDLPEALSPTSLAAILRRSGLLGEAGIRDVAVESSRATVLSQIVRVRLVYDGSVPEAPPSLIYKTSHPDRVAIGWNAGRHEVAFYREVAPWSAGRVPRCFEAACDEAAQTWHLLLEDLTDTHATAGEWPLPPPLPVCEAIVEGHARHQATVWDGPLLERLMESWRWRDAAAAGETLERIAGQVARFVERLGDRLPPERRDVYARLLDRAPRLIRRFQDRRNLTVVQGDAHVWNCFLPKDGGDDVRLFDWDSWRVDIGASDLAYMMAVHWYPDRRGRMERPLLDRYHAALLAHGVRDYDRRNLDDDYRFAVLWQTLWPVSQESYGIPPVIWWNNLERVFLAVDDLGCAALLRG